MFESFLSPEERASIARMSPYAMRVIRMVGYGLCAMLLLAANTYPLDGFLSIAAAIALLGAGSASARLGQLALATLLAMALIPYPMVLSLLP